MDWLDTALGGVLGAVLWVVLLVGVATLVGLWAWLEVRSAGHARRGRRRW